MKWLSSHFFRDSPFLPSCTMTQHRRAHRVFFYMCRCCCSKAKCRRTNTNRIINTLAVLCKLKLNRWNSILNRAEADCYCSFVVEQVFVHNVTYWTRSPFSIAISCVSSVRLCAHEKLGRTNRSQLTMKLKQPNLISEHHSCGTKCMCWCCCSRVFGRTHAHVDVNEPNNFFDQFLGL